MAADDRGSRRAPPTPSNWPGVDAASRSKPARAAGPVIHVDADGPPFLRVAGTVDETEPHEQSQELDDSLQTKNVDAELQLLPGADRSFLGPMLDVTRQCDDCITIHTEAALRFGTTREEIVEALGVAIPVNAGATLVYPARVLDAYTVKTPPPARPESGTPDGASLDPKPPQRGRAP